MSALGAASGASYRHAGRRTCRARCLLNPLAGMVAGGLAGAGFGALSGSMADYGINDEFIKNLGKTIPKGSSALFVLVKSSTPDKVLPELEVFKPRVLKTSLSKSRKTNYGLPLRQVPKRLENTSLAIAAVAIFGAVYFGSSVLAPVACALFIIAIAWPLQCRLQVASAQACRAWRSSSSPSLSCLWPSPGSRLGLRAGRTVADHRCGAVPAPLWAGHGMAGGPWHCRGRRCGLSISMSAGWCGTVHGDHRARQHDHRVLAGRFCLRDPWSARGR